MLISQEKFILSLSFRIWHDFCPNLIVSLKISLKQMLKQIAEVEKSTKKLERPEIMKGNDQKIAFMRTIREEVTIRKNEQICKLKRGAKITAPKRDSILAFKRR